MHLARMLAPPLTSSPPHTAVSPPSDARPRPSTLPLDHIRCLVRPEHLPRETRRRVEGQSRALAAAFAQVAEVLGMTPPEDVAMWPQPVPPGWWWNPHCLGHCTPSGLATLPACGTRGVNHDFRRGDGDFRLRGFAPPSAALIAMHEIAHTIYFLRLGREGAEAALAAADGVDAAMPGWPEFCAEASDKLFGRALPAGYDFGKWPYRAPGSLMMLDALAERLAAFALWPVKKAEARRNMARAEQAMFAEFILRQKVEGMLAKYGAEAAR